MNKTPRIILFADAIWDFGPGMLSGIAQYSALNGSWIFYRKTPIGLRYGPDLNLWDLAEWNPDGFICSMDRAKDFAPLKIPRVA